VPRLVYEDPNNGEEVKVEIGPDYPEITIGRNPGNMVRVGNPSVSREHAKIVYEGDHYTIHDLGSSNGTFVNGNEVDTQVVEAGDRIRLGEFPIEFIEPDGAQIDDDTSFPSDLDEIDEEHDDSDAATVDQSSGFDFNSIELNDEQIAEDAEGQSETSDPVDSVGASGADSDRIEELETENESLKERVEELEKELDIEREDNEYLQGEIEQLEDECDTLRAQLENKNDDKEEQLQTLRDRNEELEKRVEQLEEDRAEKKEIFKDLKGDLQQLIEQNKQKQERIEQLEQQVS
jgi:hypothetical protein